MSKGTVVFLIRAALGLAGGWLLAHFFLKSNSWIIVLALAALVVIAAYLSEAWRSRRQG
jgi:hypothetical protein